MRLRSAIPIHSVFKESVFRESVFRESSVQRVSVQRISVQHVLPTMAPPLVVVGGFSVDESLASRKLAQPLRQTVSQNFEEEINLISSNGSNMPAYRLSVKEPFSSIGNSKPS